jgi:hypothetical protein
MAIHQSIDCADVPVPYLTGGLRRMLGRSRSRGELAVRPLTLWRARQTAGRVVAIVALALALLVFAAYLQLSQAQAEEHSHPAADVPIHEKFYSSWMMPDKPDRSCCNQRDCYPTEVRYREGFWEARRREDGEYVRVPWEKVEQNRDNPDGRNHVCMPPPSLGYYKDEVFCFALGSGI